MHPGTVLPALPNIHLALGLMGKLSWGHTCPYFLEEPLAGPHVGEVEKASSLPQDSLAMCSPSSICQPLRFHVIPDQGKAAGNGRGEWGLFRAFCFTTFGSPYPHPLTHGRALSFGAYWVYHPGFVDTH